jgi:hypothetical protein
VLLFQCKATSDPLAIALGLRECYLEGANGVKYQGITPDSPEANEGPVSVDGNVVQNPKDQRHRICLKAAGQWPDNSFQFATTLVCSPFE